MGVEVSVGTGEAIVTSPAAATGVGVVVPAAGAALATHGAVSGFLNLARISQTDINNNRGTKGVYEFPDAKDPGKTYVGQSGNVERRLDQHAKSGKLAPGTEPKVTEVKGGKTAREVAEQRRINQLGGTKEQPSSQTSNKRNPIGKKREKKIEDEYGHLKDN